ncbi:uncharacterized protein I303_105013 [Kwoniella dejecticola CBS 10117]|uniref:Structural maintenance of chromosomes protein 5 n=1 Tax=Kwoniella dejecticola CBS 10117 TaxID=1296121 RepID=A0AAJ8KRU9_9TREE
MNGRFPTASLRRRIESDDEDENEDSPQEDLSSSPFKRRKTIEVEDSQDLGDSDLDDLNSDEDPNPDGDPNLYEDSLADLKSDANGSLAENDQMEVDGEEAEDAPRGTVAFRPEYERDNDGYVPGSVVRIKMTNFMTYDYVEFRPGPHLNMILGPNGTGKSSIAAAIAIGLGFAPKVMGRSNELKAYVKQGADQAEVEIELKGKKGKRNTVIWRKFNRIDEKSEWKKNRSSCTRREVLDHVQNYGIQANNLCSFLPQDKVAEFAKMAPEVVLTETMRAAGDPRLTKWHENLVEKGAKSKEIASTLEGHITQRDGLQTRVDGLAPDVEHVQEREAREMEAEILRHVVAMVQHEQLKTKVEAARRETKTAQERMKKLQARRQPLKHLKEHWEKKAHKDDAKVDSIEGKYKEGMKDIRSKHNQATNIGDKSSQVDMQLDRLKTNFSRRRDEKKSLQDKIARCQEILDEPREEVETEVRTKQKERAEMTARYRRKENDLEAVKDEYNDNKRMFADLNKELEDVTRKQKILENIEVQKENAARELDPSIGWLLDWLQHNGHTLESAVYKPAMISVSVPDKNYAWQVEQCTNLQQRKTFICTSQADFDKLLSFSGKATYPPSMTPDGRRIPGGTVRLNLSFEVVNEATVNPQRPCSSEQLRKLGLDGFAIDYVEAEPAVIAYLCNKANLHKTALSQKPSHSINGDAVTALGVTRWATRDDVTTSTQSAYGKRQYVHRTLLKQPARAFNLAVDRDAVKRIVEEIARKKKTKFDREHPHSALKARLDQGEDDLRDLKSSVGNLENEIKALQNKAKRWQTAVTDIEATKLKLRKLEAQPSQEEERAKLKAEKLKYAKARLRPLDQWLSSCENVLGHCTDMITANFAQMQSSVNQQAISARMNEGLEILETAKAEWDDAAARLLVAERNAAEKREIITTGMREVSADVRDEVRTRTGDPSALPPLEELQAQLQTLRAQLELAVNIPGNVIARYNDYKDKLEKAQEIVNKEEAELNSIKRDMKQTLDMFDPALETLVQAVSKKFSAAFARVKCTGEVRIRRVEGDFSAWGIEILVSYRDEDNLAILTGSHQSGGERSLATVTYLMSLSEMSRTPFSLVDEINQGMDQRAERAVHNQLVEVTCDADAGQYFLITPKLLTGLTYHPKMKVLIINNGPHLPDSRKKDQRYGDLAACLKTYQDRQAIAAN